MKCRTDGMLRALLVILAVPPIPAQNNLDYLKADILQYVLDQEEKDEDGKTAAEILEVESNCTDDGGLVMQLRTK